MAETYQDVIVEQALATRRKWENIVEKNLPSPCKKCGQDKFPEDFVMHYMSNPIAGKYRYLYECKQCKKDRIYEKRWVARETFESTLGIIYAQLQASAKQRRVHFHLKEMDLFNMWEEQKWKCYYTGYEMTYEYANAKSWKLTDKTKYQVACDRLDPEGNYDKDNCVLCCAIAHKMKWTMTEDEFYTICNDIVRK